MKNKIIWLMISCFMVFSLLVASCKPTASANPINTTVPTIPTGTTASETTIKPTTATTPTGPEMVKVSLKKLDGTVVEKTVEKPKYGGELILMRNIPLFGWDEAVSPMYRIHTNVSQVLQELLVGDWARGKGGTEEVTWSMGGWFNANYEIGDLAESWEIQQPDTITFHIRQGIHFALNPALEASRLVGGRELTADDIVWNMKRVFFEIKTASAYTNASVSRPLDVSNPDKWTVVVKAPEGQIWSTFEYVSEWMDVYPPEVGKKYGGFEDWTRVIGTGPFILTDYVAMSSVTYVRNPNYWRKDSMFPENQLPYVDSVKLLIIPDRSTEASAMRTGKVDLDNTGVLWEDAASYKKTNPELKYADSLGSQRLLGGREDLPALPFKDINVRRALMMAINLQQIKDTYFGGKAEVLSFPVPPTIEWMRAYTPIEQLGLAPDGFDTKKIFSYDPEGAKKLLAEAGYPNGFKTEVVCIAPDVDLLSIIKDYWSKINVDLKLDVQEVGVYQALLNKKAHKEMYYRTWANLGLPQTMDPERMGHTYNWAMVTDPEISERYDRMAALQPRTDKWWEVVKDNNLYVVHRVDYIVAPQPYSSTFWQPWLKRYYGESDVGVWNSAKWWAYVWVDQELKKELGH